MTPKPRKIIKKKSDEPLTVDSLMTFGAHKGKKLSDVPAEYLLWLYKNKKGYPALIAYIHNHLDALNAQNSINNKGIFFDKKYYLKRR